MKASSLLSVAVFVLLLNIPNAAHSQVLIPDTMMRGWLNSVIPGLVDVNGIMDTLNPAIATVDSMSFNYPAPQPYPVGPIDLEGIQYMHSLRSLVIGTGNLVVECSALPMSLRNLYCYGAGGPNTIHLPQLPANMDRITIDGGGSESKLDITGIPDHIEEFELINLDTIIWHGVGYASNLIIEEGLGSTLPAISVGSLNLRSLYLNNTDISLVEAQSVEINNCGITGPILFNSQTSSLNLVSNFSSFPIEAFPPSLSHLLISGDLDFCLPWLPNTLISIDLYANEFPCLTNRPTELLSVLYYSDAGYELVPADQAVYCCILNSTCPGPYPGISGSIFVDLNADGIRDPGEPALLQASVTVEPGSHVVPCDVQGDWQIGVHPGTYSIMPSLSYPYIASISPPQHTADLQTMGSADTLNDFAVTLVPNIEDLQAFLYATPSRPGFENEVGLSCRNYGTVPMDAQLTFQFDADQTWVGSSVAPDVLTGNTATWNLNGMAMGATTNITVTLNTAVGTLLGTEITHVLTSLPNITDQTPMDNMVMWTDSVVGSFDPNDKLLSPATMTPAQVQAGNKRIEYTIRFQNTGTAAAERVVIADTLPAGLKLGTVRFDGSSHPCTWYLQDGVLFFVHEDINLPDSTSDELGSNGFVRFSILPSTDLANGETVTNIAHIVFDFNEAIVTPPAVFTVELITGIAPEQASKIRVLPNPAHDLLFVSLPNGEHPASILVRDALGRTVLRSELSGNGAVDVSMLPTGVYLLEAKSEGSAAQVRFVKQ